MTAKITKQDIPRIREWLNCAVASVDTDGDVWVEGPMIGHWLNKDRIATYLDWRKNQSHAKRGRGRPPISSSGESGQRYQVTIPPTVADKLRKHGKGSLSQGIAKASAKLAKGSSHD